MHKMRALGQVLMLLGPDSDRDGWAKFLEQSGFQAQAFKNPQVFFEAVQEQKPFTVVLETSALRCKLSEWVGDLQKLSEATSWIVLAPMNQYPILSSYQNRGLAEIVATDSMYTKERLVWALDREIVKWELNKIRTLEFIESTAAQQKAEVAAATKSIQTNSLEEACAERFQEAQKNNRPLLLGVLSLDDAEEVKNFWGEDTANQVHELMQKLIKQAWGFQNYYFLDNSHYILINATTPEFLSDVQELQGQLQEQGQNRFGFRISLSGGVCEAFVHANDAVSMKQKADAACRHMSNKGGGRVGLPKPIQGGPGGNIPQNMG